MSVTNGENADDTNFNSSFMSREVDTSTIGKVDLNETSSTVITDLQGTLNSEFTEIDDLRTLSGTSLGAQNLGAFTGSTITDNVTVKVAFQELETEVELKEDSGNKGAVNGYAPLDGSGLLPVANLPVDAMTFEGMWNASTNTPTLADGTGATGEVYLVSVGGTQDLGSGSLTFQAGDKLIHDGSIWNKLDTIDQVISVNGQLGVVVLDIDDVTPTTTKGDIIAEDGSNAVRKAVGTDGQVLTADSSDPTGVAWSTGAGGGGAFSIITGNNSNFEATVGDWTNYDDGAVATPVDGTGGAPTVISIARNTTAANLLNGDAVGLISKTAFDGLGEGVSLSSLTVPDFFQGKEMQIRIKYKTLTGYVNDFYRVFAYDVTNGTLLNVLNNAGGDGSLSTTPTAGLEFIGSVVMPSDATQVRLVIHGTTTDATAFDVAIDDVKWEEISGVNGPVISEWESFTPTGAWTTNTAYVGVKRQVGDSLEMQIGVKLTGAPDVAALEINIPDGLTIDFAKVAEADATAHFGTAFLLDIGTLSNNVLAQSFLFSNTVIRFIASGSGTVTNVVPFTFASGDEIRLLITVPIVEFDSGAIISTAQANVSTIIVKARTTSTAQTITNNTVTDIQFTQEDIDTHNSWDGTNTFTAPKSGKYRISTTLITETIAWTVGEDIFLRFLKNSSIVSECDFIEVSAANTQPFKLQGDDIFDLNEGDTLKVSILQRSGVDLDILTGTGDSYISITSIPDFTIFGVRSAREYKFVELSSDTSTSGAGGNDVDIIGASLPLTPGTWTIGYSMPLFFDYISGSSVLNGVDIWAEGSISGILANSLTGTNKRQSATIDEMTIMVNREFEITLTSNETVKLVFENINADTITKGTIFTGTISGTHGTEALFWADRK